MKSIRLFAKSVCSWRNITFYQLLLFSGAVFLYIDSSIGRGIVTVLYVAMHAYFLSRTRIDVDNFDAEDATLNIAIVLRVWIVFYFVLACAAIVGLALIQYT